MTLEYYLRNTFHFDGLDSTIALTDASENITDTYSWTAFGNLDASTDSSVNPYRYVGQWGYYDDGAMGCPFDMLLLGVRYYIPAYGRFLTWDPVPALNLYDYTRNSPTIYIDPTGTFRLCYCPFRGRVGRLFVDCSCGGLPLWVRSEHGGAWIQVRCGEWVDADGFNLGGVTFKIDGSTCITLRCSSSGISIDCCINFLVSLRARCPRPITENDRWDSPPTSVGPPVLKRRPIGGGAW
ncbi:MAG TPA: RHS repeat-associated core domain-containing protein [Fimbriimonadaceae bacterium]|nr:RHS repeat-associated core domain-containing protein [Fimbriimonadaceae bacterium]